MKTYRVIEDGIEYEIRENLAGDKVWYLNNQIHRRNGPAVETIDGYKAWYKHGKTHRDNGAASIYPDGAKFYYLNNQQYENIKSDEEWLLFQIIT